MPLYEYLCAACDKRFEALRPMSQAAAPIACPRCAALTTQRAISVCAAISKEGGASHMLAGSSGGCGSCGGGNCAACGK